MKVSIVEDDEDSRILLQEALSNDGYSVDSSSDGEEALTKIKASAPDLIISDILMPKMDGFELCRRVKADKALRSIPFVFYTATYTNSEDESFALSLGASKFIIKPLEPMKFLHIISEVLHENSENKIKVIEKPIISDHDFDNVHSQSLMRKLDKKVEDLKKQHKALLQSETRFRGLFDNSPVAMLEQDYSYISNTLDQIRQQGADDLSEYLQSHPEVLQEWAKKIICIDVNNAALTFFDTDNKKKLLDKLGKIPPVDLHQTLEKELFAIWKGQHHCLVEAKIRTLTGEQRDVEIRWSVSSGSEHDYSRVLVCIIDITERKQAEQAVHAMNAQLEERVAQRTAELESALKELQSFSYSVSHDLRAPLRSINGYCAVLLDDYLKNLDDNGKSYLNKVRDASKRMGVLIDDLLTLSQVTMNDLRRESLDMSGIAHEFLAELREREPQRRVEIDITPGLIVDADRRLLHIMLENLLENAWKFTCKKPDALIKLGAVQQNGKQVYYISDNGAGFDMRYKDKLFNAFQRLHSQDEFPGTGIGLATVARILERHGNKIWVESELGQKTIFYFTFD